MTFLVSMPLWQLALYLSMVAGFTAALTAFFVSMWFLAHSHLVTHLPDGKPEKPNE